ncbi:hypothetical protein P4571_08570 [Niallia alba]|nr:hypothetical protein [Niallia alba]
MIWWISGIALIGFITIMAIMTAGSRDDDLFNRDEIACLEEEKRKENKIA